MLKAKMTFIMIPQFGDFENRQNTGNAQSGVARVRSYYIQPSDLLMAMKIKIVTIERSVPSVMISPASS